MAKQTNECFSGKIKPKCDICNKIFSNKNNLKTHVLTIHQKILPFECPYPLCKKRYPNKSRYNVHLRTHLGYKPFICDICSRSFNESGNLKAHLLKHNPIKQFKCPHCEKAYKSKGHLKEHIDIVHLNVKKYQCELCGKLFGKKAILIDHIRTHTKEKPFHCPYSGCEKSFAEKGNMKIHYKRHLIKEENKKITNIHQIAVNSLTNSNTSTIGGSNETYSSVGGTPCFNLDLDYYFKITENENQTDPKTIEKDEIDNSLLNINMINLDLECVQFFEGVGS